MIRDDSVCRYMIIHNLQKKQGFHTLILQTSVTNNIDFYRASSKDACVYPCYAKWHYYEAFQFQLYIYQKPRIISISLNYLNLHYMWFVILLSHTDNSPEWLVDIASWSVLVEALALGHQQSAFTTELCIFVRIALVINYFTQFILTRYRHSQWATKSQELAQYIECWIILNNISIDNYNDNDNDNDNNNYNDNNNVGY